MSQLITLQNEQSDEESTSSSVDKIIRGKGKKYVYESTFDSMEAALEQIQKEKIWSYYHTKGDKRFYRCNLAKAKGKQCSIGIYLLKDQKSLNVQLSRVHGFHDHTKVLAVCKEARELIQKLLETNKRFKPKELITQIERNNV